jgi:beta-glucosidase-like glycosyl hydrolase
VRPLAALVLPAIRWDAERGFDPALPGAEAALSLGVGGFIVFGGERNAVARLVQDITRAASHPLLIASDLERGAGQQVEGLTSLPPAQALGALGTEAVARAAAITAREARDVGINWALAPVVDLDAEPANPIVQTRAFGAAADAVAAAGERWIRACQAGGVLACAKHYPGHGRTTADSHAELPVVAAARTVLEEDLLPFRRAVEAGVAGVMTAHVAYPALDASRAPATYSRSIVGDLLRGELGFDGMVSTDALIMEGALQGMGEAAGALRALAAGCDVLLYPKNVEVVVQSIERAAASGELPRKGLDASLARISGALTRAAAPCALGDALLAEHQEASRALACAAVRLVRGAAEAPRRGVEVVVVDDDAGGPYPVPPRNVFADELAARGVALEPGAERVVLLFSDVKAWKARATLSAATRRALLAALDRPATTVLFGHPRLADDVPGSGPLLCAWSGDPVMQRAAAERLLAG